MLQSLKKGQEIAFIFKPSNNSIKKDTSQDTVALQPVGFKRAYAHYMQCINTMIPYSFYQIEKSSFHFDSNSSALKPEYKKRLNFIVEHVKATGNITKIRIEGHSDSIGTFTDNRELTAKRMTVIKAYLKQQGIDPILFYEKNYTDRKPIAKNNTKAGRAKNRRVEVRLYQ